MALIERKIKLSMTVAFATWIVVLSSCVAKNSTEKVSERNVYPDTLRVATLYSPTSYFTYRDQEMGYDYSLVKKFAEDKNMVLDLRVASSMSKMVEMLDSGLIDLIAYEIPITAEFRNIHHTGPVTETYQVLVQRKKVHSDSLLRDVTDLVGREVCVEKNSKYQYRLENLNDELGGGMNIRLLDLDSMITEDLIRMVSEGRIPLTVVDSDIARINRTYFKGLDISLQLSLPQRQAWGVSPKKSWLGDSIDVWFQADSTVVHNDILLKQYFEKSKRDTDGESLLFEKNFENGRISPYDELFKKYAKEIGWDWRLLAAQGYTESHFNPEAKSWAGAGGIMQLMPKTASRFGLSLDQINDPEANIATAVKLIKSLEDSFKEKVSDDEERKKFIIAAYNSGIAHILDARAIAVKLGKNPQIWNGNVRDALILKSDPQFYNDPVVRFGYFRGSETADYVQKVYRFYENAKRHNIPA